MTRMIVLLLAMGLTIGTPALAAARAPTPSELEATLSSLTPEQLAPLRELERAALDLEFDAAASAVSLDARRLQARAADHRTDAARQERLAHDLGVEAAGLLDDSERLQALEQARATLDRTEALAAVQLEGARAEVKLAGAVTSYLAAAYDRADLEVEAERLRLFAEATGDESLEPVIARAMQSRDRAASKEARLAGKVATLEYEADTLAARARELQAEGAAADVPGEQVAEATPEPTPGAASTETQAAVAPAAVAAAPVAPDPEVARVRAELEASNKRVAMLEERLSSSFEALEERIEATPAPTGSGSIEDERAGRARAESGLAIAQQRIEAQAARETALAAERDRISAELAEQRQAARAAREEADRLRGELKSSRESLARTDVVDDAAHQSALAELRQVRRDLDAATQTLKVREAKIEELKAEQEVRAQARAEQKQATLAASESLEAARQEAQACAAKVEAQREELWNTKLEKALLEGRLTASAGAAPSRGGASSDEIEALRQEVRALRNSTAGGGGSPIIIMPPQAQWPYPAYPYPPGAVAPGTPGYPATPPAAAPADVTGQAPRGGAPAAAGETQPQARSSASQALLQEELRATTQALEGLTEAYSEQAEWQQATDEEVRALLDAIGRAHRKGKTP